MMANYEVFFERHLSVIKAQFVIPKSAKNVFFMFLDLQMSFFKFNIKNNDVSTMGLPYTMNHMTQL